MFSPGLKRKSPSLSSWRNSHLKKCSGFEVAHLHEQTQPVMWQPVPLWTKASSKPIFFPFFLSNEYLCTILVLLSYLLIIEPLTGVTWCHLLILGCQCPQCGFTMQLESGDDGKTLHFTHLGDSKQEAPAMLRFMLLLNLLLFWCSVGNQSPPTPPSNVFILCMCVYIYVCLYSHRICIHIHMQYM